MFIFCLYIKHVVQFRIGDGTKLSQGIYVQFETG